MPMVEVGTDAKGRAIRRPEVHGALLIKEKMQKRKNEILRLLNSTRQDQARMGMDLKDLSVIASKIMETAKKLDEKVIDAAYEELYGQQAGGMADGQGP